VARNWRCQTGEVGIVARRNGVYHFFEVRTRRWRAFGTPEESMDQAGRLLRLEVYDSIS
jgi:Holliday junction resolvase-like predicted endonuclease